MFFGDNVVDRVVLGPLSGGGYGLRVSRPGYDVQTATGEQLMLSSSDKPLQIVGRGTFSYSASEQSLVLPDLGFKPFVILTCARYHVGLRYASNTQAYCKFADAGLSASLDGTLYYQITDVPWD